MLETLMNSIVPGTVVGVVAGIIILLLEYRTKWFANYVPRKLSNSDVEFYTRRKLLDWIEMLGIVVFLAMFVWGIFQLLQFTEPRSVELEDISGKTNVLKSISDGETESFFTDSVFVTITDINYANTDDTATYCSFIVGSPGYDSVIVEKAVLASVNKATFAFNYELRVTRIALFGGCDLLISRLNDQ